MSFVEQEDVFQPIEKLMTEIFEEFGGGRHVTSPFPRIPFREAMLKYGSDKPDLRAKLELVDITDVFEGSEFKAFAGKHVRALPVPAVQDQPRKFFDQLGDYAVSLGAKGLAWVRVAEDGSLTGPIAKFLTEENVKVLTERLGLEAGHAVFFGAGEFDEVSKIMGAVRVEAAKRAGHFEEGVFRFCWIVDFPMYEKDEETGAIDFSHNPFSMPQGGLEALETQDPLDILAGSTTSSATVSSCPPAPSGTTSRRSCSRPSRSRATTGRRSRRSSRACCVPSASAPRRTAASRRAWTGSSCCWPTSPTSARRSPSR